MGTQKILSEPCALLTHSALWQVSCLSLLTYKRAL